MKSYSLLPPFETNTLTNINLIIISLFFGGEGGYVILCPGSYGLPTPLPLLLLKKIKFPQSQKPDNKAINWHKEESNICSDPISLELIQKHILARLNYYKLKSACRNMRADILAMPPIFLHLSTPNDKRESNSSKCIYK